MINNTDRSDEARVTDLEARAELEAAPMRRGRIIIVKAFILGVAVGGIVWVILRALLRWVT
jgi:hypothetical protein